MTTRDNLNYICILLVLCIIIVLATAIILVTFQCNKISKITSDNTMPDINANDDELNTKYRSVFDWQKYCGDFESEQLYYLNDQCKKYDIPIEIMLALICTESGFQSDATSGVSSAAGYCQVIRSTAEWVYEDLLQYGQYNTTNHTKIMTTNWKLNIEIGCRLMYQLYRGYGSWELAIQRYYGSDTESNLVYLDKVNSNMYELFGKMTNDFT